MQRIGCRRWRQAARRQRSGRRRARRWRGPSGGGPGGGPAGGEGPAATVSPAKASSGAGGSVALTVTVSGPGTVTATATVAVPKGGAKKSAAKKITVAKASLRAKKAGPVKLVLKLNKAGKKLLGQKGKLTAKAAIAFKPASGPTATTSKSVTFKKPKPSPKRRGGR